MEINLSLNSAIADAVTTTAVRLLSSSPTSNGAGSEIGQLLRASVNQLGPRHQKSLLMISFGPTPPRNQVGRVVRTCHMSPLAAFRDRLDLRNSVSDEN